VTTSYVSSAAAEATTLTMPSHSAGDLLLMYAFRTTTGAITVPPGWLPIAWRAASNSMSTGVWYKTAASSGETSGTWTDAAILACVVYTDTANHLMPGGSNSNGATGSTSLTYQPIGGYSGSTGSGSGFRGSGWCIGCGATAINSTNTEDAPAGMTNRIAQAGASVGEIAVHDTNGDVTAWASTVVTTGSSNNHCITLQIYDTGISKSGGGGMIGGGNLSGGFQ